MDMWHARQEEQRCRHGLLPPVAWGMRHAVMWQRMSQPQQEPKSLQGHRVLQHPPLGAGMSAGRMTRCSVSLASTPRSGGAYFVSARVAAE